MLSTEGPRRGDSLARRLNICVDRDNFSRRLLVLGKKKKKTNCLEDEDAGGLFQLWLRGIGWEDAAAVRLLAAIYSHIQTCSSVNILWHTSGSIVVTLRTYRITFAHLETQHSISSGLWRETGNLWL